MSDSFDNILSSQCELATRYYKNSFGYFSLKNFKVADAEEEEYTVNSVKLCTKVHAYPCITILSLTDCDIGDQGFKYLFTEGLSANKTIKELNVSRNRLGSECASYLSTLIRKNSTIKKLSANSNRFCNVWVLRGNVIGSLNLSGITNLLQAISESQTLISVDLHSNAIGGFPGSGEFEFGATTEKLVSDLLSKNTALHYLNLMYNNLTTVFSLASRHRNFGMKSLCGMSEDRLEFNLPWPHLLEPEIVHIRYELHKLSNIVTLDFANTTYENIYKLLESLNDFLSVKRLNLSNVKVSTSANPMQIPKILARVFAHKACRLTHVDLSDNAEFTGAGLQLIAESLKSNKSIKEFLLGNCNGDTTLATSFAVSLVLNTTLTALDLQRNVVRCEGAKQIAIALTDNRALRSLRLSDNKIGQIGAAYITYLLYKNPTIEEIQLDRNNLTTNAGLTLQGQVDDAFTNMGQMLSADSDWNPTRSKLVLNLQKSGLQAASSTHIFKVASRLNMQVNTLFDLDLGLTSDILDATQVLSRTLIEGALPLRRLSLAGSRMKPQACEELCPGIAQSRTLEVLDLSDNMIGLRHVAADDDIEAHEVHAFTTVSLLFISIGENPHLKHVNLRKNSLFGLERSTLAGVHATTNSFAFSPESLSALSAVLAPAVDAGVGDGGASMDTRALVSLDLLQNQLPQSSIAPADFDRATSILDELLVLMRRRKRLKSLCGLATSPSNTFADLRQLGITPLWARVLSHEMHRSTHLYGMDVSNNAIGDLGAVHVANALSTSYHLRLFILDNTEMSTGSKKKIEDAKAIAFGQRIGVLYLFEEDIHRVDKARRFRGVGPCRALLEYLWGEDVSLEKYTQYM